MSAEVAFVGGPADGQVRAVEADRHGIPPMVIAMLIPPPSPWPAASEPVEPGTVLYERYFVVGPRSSRWEYRPSGP